MEKNKYTSLATMAALFLSMLTLSSTMEMHSKSYQVDGEKPLVRSDEEIWRLYEEWLRKYGKLNHEREEKVERFMIFKDNLKYIDEHNRPENNYSFNLGLNQFADLTNDEFKSIYLNHDAHISSMSSPPVGNSSLIQIRENAPDCVNWTELGLVNPVKDQGHCASGWAFAAAGAVEALNKWITNRLEDLSEQELVDCVTRNGCSGGEIHKAFGFIYAEGGLATEAAYPYVGRKEPWQQCESHRVENPIAPIDGYEPVRGEDYLGNALVNQPVAVTVDAASRDFQLYRSGIFNGQCGDNVNHGMLAVGYAKDYWIVRNSWGTRWGEEGYIRIARNVREELFGKCGIVRSAYYPKTHRRPVMSSKVSNDRDGHSTHA